jgi:hypothetical protein
MTSALLERIELCTIMRQQKIADAGLWIAAAIDSPLGSFEGHHLRIATPLKLQSSVHGRTVRPKAKSQSSNW